MLIKEMHDVLKLVELLPPDQQMRCAHWCCMEVINWEERIQDPHLSDQEYSALALRRYKQRDALRRKNQRR
jgi:hypothetical protein